MAKSTPTFRDPAVQRPFASINHFLRFNIWTVQWLVILGLPFLALNLLIEYLRDGALTLNSVYFTLKVLPFIYLLILTIALRDHREKKDRAEKRARRNAEVEQQLQSRHEHQTSIPSRTEPDDPLQSERSHHDRPES